MSFGLTVSIEVREHGDEHVFERVESISIAPFPGLRMLFCDCCDFDQFIVMDVAWHAESGELSCGLQPVDWDDDSGRSATAVEHFVRTGWKQAGITPKA